MRHKFQRLNNVEFGHTEKRYNIGGLFGGGGGGGGGTSTEYVQSPEAREAMQMMLPSIRRLGEAGAAGGQLWDVPSVPSMAPTEGWFSGLDPNVTAGMWEPYERGSMQLAEQMGAGGMGGSARGGWSGAAGAGLGRFWEDASTSVGQQAWGMMQPSRKAQMQEWQQDIMARQFPYTAIPGIFGASMPSPVVTQGGGGGKK